MKSRLKYQTVEMPENRMENSSLPNDLEELKENSSLPNDLEEFKERFGWEEYFVVSLMLLVSALIGIYFHWKGQKSNAEYLLGGKQMGVLPVSMSLIAT